MEFNIEKEVLELGINVAIVVIKGMNNVKENKKFNNYRDVILKDLKSNLTEETITNDSVLKGFWQLHRKVGKTSKHDMPSPENLMNMLLENGFLPSINLIVDIYNLVSVKTKLALGAHDLDNIKGKVSLRLTNGNETFLPIGYSKEKPISKGEYAYIDENNDVLCRMEVRQVEKTKVTENTSNCMYIVQGNENVSNEEIKKAVDLLIELTLKYCGGDAEVIYKKY